MNRRYFLYAAGAAGIGLAGAALLRTPKSATVAGEFEVVMSDKEWYDLLGAERYAILRKHETEWRYTSPLLKEHRKGTFHCAGCDLPLYSSETKYDSRTGWPSFWQALPNAVRTSVDRSAFMVRTEVHCRRCGGHLGHIFDDGPRPTGKRHCINGLSLTFKAA